MVQERPVRVERRLAEFPSAVEAVRAAMQFQSNVNELAIGDAEDKRILFRVGLNIGDVIVEAHDIFGDGVNIAARLKSIAEPGGICISQTVFNHAPDKVTFYVEEAGEQILKNIAAAALAQLGRTTEAKEELEKAIFRAPGALDMYVRNRAPWFRPEDHAHLVEGLRKAGWEG